MTSEYWPAANANDAVRGKNNGNRLTDVDHQDHCGEADQQLIIVEMKVHQYHEGGNVCAKQHECIKTNVN